MMNVDPGHSATLELEDSWTTITESELLTEMDDGGNQTILFLLDKAGLGHGDLKLLKRFLEGLSKPYTSYAFFLYDEASELLTSEDAAEVRELFSTLVEMGLKVYVAYESLNIESHPWVSTCSIRDLPLLIQAADKVVSL